jgi:predicted SnoaL-like aldol condensation-catalyzing enzyme
MKLLASAIAFSFVAVAAHAAEPVAPTKDQQALLKSSDPQLAANKKLVFDMWRTFLTAHHIDEADKFLAPEYHQHNPNADTGLAGVKAYFTAIVAERDLVVVSLVREGKDKDGKAYTTTWFDMFRIANGKIVEHWDVAQKP